MIQNHNIHTIPQSRVMSCWNEIKNFSREEMNTLMTMIYIHINEDVPVKNEEDEDLFSMTWPDDGISADEMVAICECNRILCEGTCAT